MASRKTLWLPFSTGSINSVANVQNATKIDAQYLVAAAAQFKGTLLSVKGMLSFAQDVPSNALERYCFAIRVAPINRAATEPDLFDDLSKDWLWRVDGFIGGPGGDSTALANVMAPVLLSIDSKSKRVIGFNDSIEFVHKTSGVMKFGAAGRHLLLEA